MSNDGPRKLETCDDTCPDTAIIGRAKAVKLRRPKFDFKTFTPHWARNREFAQALNAGSPIPTCIEPYLNQVMRRAADTLGPAYSRLRQDITLFIGQETAHYQMHARYDEAMATNGYPRVREFAAQMKATYQRFLTAKSLKFNLAYCAGFETFSQAYAYYFYEAIDDLFAGADDTTAAKVWHWHLAEEFEHRSVCHEAAKALHCGYAARLYGLVYAFFHLSVQTKRILHYLLEVDRARMSAQEIADSRRSERRYQRRASLYLLPRILRMALPFYDPRRQRTPRGLDAYLQRIEQEFAS